MQLLMNYGVALQLLRIMQKGMHLGEAIQKP